MFNMGGGELILVGLVALLVIKPEKLPGFATSIGRFFGQLQNAFNDAKGAFKDGIKEAMPKEIQDIKDSTKNLLKPLDVFDPSDDSKKE